MKMFNFVVICYVILVVNAVLINAQISDKRLCANQDCTEPISIGKTILRYGSSGSRILSFAPNEDVTIYSKSAGSRADLWGVEINGKRGYVPKTHVREFKILTKNVNALVDTEESEPATPQVPSEEKQTKEKPSPDSVREPYEVVDGTTILFNPEDAITPSSAESPVQASAAPNFESQQTQPLKPLTEKVQEAGVPKPQEHEEKGPTSAPEPANSVSGSLGKNGPVAVEDDGLINSVLSSISKLQNLIEGSGVEAEEDEEEDEDDEEEDDGEVEDEDDELDKEVELPKAQETVDPATAELNNVKEDGKETENRQENIQQKETIKKEDGKIIEHNQEQIKISAGDKIENSEQATENVVEIPKESLLPATEQVNADQTSETSAETLHVEEENKKTELPKQNVQQAADDVQKVPSNSAFSADIPLGEAGIHSDFTTEEPNYEIPVPGQPPVDEVTPNPVESVPLPLEQPKTPDIAVEATPEQELPSQEPTAEINVNNANPAESHIHSEEQESATAQNDSQVKEVVENVEEPEKQNEDGEQPIEQPEQHLPVLEQLDNTSQLIHSELPKEVNISESMDFELPKEDVQKSEEVVENQQQADSVETLEKQPENIEQDKKLEEEEKISQDLLEEVAAVSLDSASMDQESETTEVPREESSGLFSGIYSSVFGSSDAENNAVDVEEGTELKKVEDVKVEDDVPEPIIDQNMDSVENKAEGTTEPSARGILWGSSIRKELEDKNGKHQHDFDSLLSKEPLDQSTCSADPLGGNCPLQETFSEEKQLFSEEDTTNTVTSAMEFPPMTYEVLVVLAITAVTVVVFLWGYMFIDKSRKEGPLIAKINELNKHFLVLQKENEILTEKLVETNSYGQAEAVSTELVQDLQEQLLEAQNSRLSLEEQMQTLEKELENSTEVGLELNRMLSEFLSSENGSDTLVANVEQLQRQIIEQQGIINTYNENLSVKETENHELKLELDIGNTKVTDLQAELNKMALNLLKAEEDKEQSQGGFEAEIASLNEQLKATFTSFQVEVSKLSEQLKSYKEKYEQAQRDLDLKTNEYVLLKESISEVKKLQNNKEALKSLFDNSSVKAELLQLRKEKQLLTERVQQGNDAKCALEKQAQAALQELQNMNGRYDEADREKVEAQTKLQVLSTYFKDREAQLQKELSKQESMWVEKQGEATSTIERIKYMQEEMQNYKAQNESLKQEIVAQEVQMKSQISVLEKRAHENWVAARQAERKLEDVKQEATQLRNRLTLRERNLNEEKQNRLQPLEQNGELPVSPLHIPNDTAASPPLLYGTRDHLTTSPPLPGLAPFLPPPPGVPFMPPPLGGVPLPPPGFMPPPPSMIPGDHRPPPLGRMSSPPLNSRYSPETRTYSPYSRNSPSPTSDDDYDRMPLPPMYRGYSPYSRGDERRDYNRPPPIRNNTRNNKGATHSSGSANSNESLEKLNRHNSKV